MLDYQKWQLAQKALNRIDDGFEYRYGDAEARAFVHRVLADYTAAISQRPDEEERSDDERDQQAAPPA